MSDDGSHWVTIEGNHILFDLSGKSLNDPSLAKDEDEEEDYQKKYDEDDYDEEDSEANQYADEFDSLTTREVMNMVSREWAEATKRGITIRMLRAEKLGIDPKLLDMLENTNPKFRKMPAEKIKSELMKWWYKKTKGNVWTITPTIEDLTNVYNEEKNKNKKHTFQKNISWPITPFQAMYYYTEGSGKTRSVNIKDININGEMIAKSDEVQDYFKRNPKASFMPLNGEQLGIHLPTYPENAFLGNISIRPIGVLYRKNDKFYYNGDIKAHWDEYDLHESTWREWGVEQATRFGSKFSGKPYDIAIEGVKRVNELKK